MLSVYIDPFERGIAFQVKDLSQEITDHIKNIGGTFYASNGWKVKVGEYSELDIARKTIFLRKSNADNLLRVDRKWDLGNNWDRDNYIRNTNIALQELVDDQANTPKVRIGYDAPIPTRAYMPKCAGTNHSNKPLIRP